MTPFNRRAQIILIVSALTASAVPGVAQAPSVCPTRT